METLIAKAHYFMKKENSYHSMEIENGEGYLAPIIESPFSSSLGAGFIKLKQAGSFAWQVEYNEVLIVLSGELYIQEGNVKRYGKKGDVFFLKDGAEIIYGTDTETELFYSLYPAKWREIRN
jgi:ethanolamine utilization protein EutQ